MTPDAFAAVVTVVGETVVDIGWSPASGPLDGYIVFVSTDGGPALPTAYVEANQATVSGEYGDEITVSISAVKWSGATLETGPLSVPSDSVRFVEDTPPPPPVAVNPALPYDFDGDGRADIAVENEITGELRFWSTNGLTLIDDQSLLSAPPGPVKAIGDFDGDGNTDLIFRDPSGLVVVFLRPGRLESFLVDSQFAISATGDFDGDGRTDLAFRNPADGSVQIWILNGGTVLGVTNISGPTNQQGWTLSGAGDFDGNGAADLFMSHSSGTQLVWFMDAGQIMVTQELDPIDGSTALVGIGDLDADGRDDLVYRSGDLLFGWLLDGSDWLEIAAIQSISSASTVSGLRDLDGNGTDDILLGRASGRISGLLMNGLSVWDDGSIVGSSNDFGIVVSP